MEALAHGASWVAVVLTALMVGTGQVAESNPIARTLIDAVGMRGFALLTPLLISALYRLLHRYADHHVYFALPAGLLAVDAVGNALVVASSGLPESALWGEIATTALLVGAVATACYVRLGRRLRANPPRRALRVGVVGLLVVTSMAAPFYGFGTDMSPVGSAEAAGPSDIVIANDDVYNDTDLTTVSSYPINSPYETYFDSETQDAFISNDTTVARFDPSTGDGVWTHVNGTGVDFRGITALNGYIYAVSSSTGSVVYKFDKDTGELIDSAKLNDRGFKDMTSGPENNAIYAGNYNSTLGESELHKISPDTLTIDSSTTISGEPAGLTSNDNAVFVGTTAGNITRITPGFGVDYTKDANLGSSYAYDVAIGPNGNLVAGGSSNIGLYNVSDGSKITDGSLSTDLRGVSAGGGYIWGTSPTVNSYRFNASDLSTDATFGSGGHTILHPDEFAAESPDLSGHVSTTDGNALENATVTTNTSKSTTTNATGYYSFDLKDGDYTITASKSGYNNQSQNITVAGSDVTGVDFEMVDADRFEMTYTLDDRTNDTLFEGEDPHLIVERPDGTRSLTSFNHNQRAFVNLLDDRTYNLTVTSDYPAVWDFYGFIAVGSIDEAPLVMQSDLWDETSSLGTPTNGTVTPTLDERLDVRFADLESSISGDGTAVTVQSPEPVEEFDYTIRDENGSAVYNGTREFDDPTRFYQGRLSDNVTNNASDLDDPTLDYSGEFANGTAFNGTTDLSFDSLGGGIGGPTGTGGGGGTASTIAGVGLLAGGAVLAYRRFGNGNLGQTVSNLVGRGR